MNGMSGSTPGVKVDRVQRKIIIEPRRTLVTDPMGGHDASALERRSSLRQLFQHQGRQSSRVAVAPGGTSTIKYGNNNNNNTLIPNDNNQKGDNTDDNFENYHDNESIGYDDDIDDTQFENDENDIDSDHDDNDDNDNGTLLDGDDECSTLDPSSAGPSRPNNFAAGARNTTNNKNATEMLSDMPDELIQSTIFNLLQEQKHEQEQELKGKQEQDLTEGQQRKQEPEQKIGKNKEQQKKKNQTQKQKLKQRRQNQQYAKLKRNISPLGDACSEADDIEFTSFHSNAHADFTSQMSTTSRSSTLAMKISNDESFECNGSNSDYKNTNNQNNNTIDHLTNHDSQKKIVQAPTNASPALLKQQQQPKNSEEQHKLYPEQNGNQDLQELQQEYQQKPMATVVVRRKSNESARRKSNESTSKSRTQLKSNNTIKKNASGSESYMKEPDDNASNITETLFHDDQSLEQRMLRILGQGPLRAAQSLSSPPLSSSSSPPSLRTNTNASKTTTESVSSQITSTQPQVSEIISLMQQSRSNNTSDYIDNNITYANDDDQILSTLHSLFSSNALLDTLLKLRSDLELAKTTLQHERIEKNNRETELQNLVVREYNGTENSTNDNLELKISTSNAINDSNNGKQQVINENHHNQNDDYQLQHQQQTTYAANNATKDKQKQQMPIKLESSMKESGENEQTNKAESTPTSCGSFQKQENENGDKEQHELLALLEDYKIKLKHKDEKIKQLTEEKDYSENELQNELNKRIEKEKEQFIQAYKVQYNNNRAPRTEDADIKTYQNIIKEKDEEIETKDAIIRQQKQQFQEEMNRHDNDFLKKIQTLTKQQENNINMIQETSNSKINVLKQTIDMKENELNTVQAILLNMKQTFNDNEIALNNMIKVEKDLNEQLKKDNDYQKQQLVLVQSQYDHVSLKCNDYQHELEQLKIQISANEKSYQTRHEKDDIEIQHLKKMIQALKEEALQKQPDTNEAYIADADNNENEIANRLKLDNETTSKELEHVKQALVKSDNQLQDYVNELTIVNAELQSALEANENYQEQIKNIQINLNGSESKNIELLQEISKLHQDIDKHKQERQFQEQQASIKKIDVSCQTSTDPPPSSLDQRHQNADQTTGTVETPKVRHPNTQLLSIDDHSYSDSDNSVVASVNNATTKSQTATNTRNNNDQNNIESINKDSISQRLVRIRDAAERASLVKDHQRFILKLKSQHEAEIQDMLKKHSESMQEIIKETREEMENKRKQIELEYEHKIANIKQRHGQEISQMKKKMKAHAEMSHESVQVALNKAKTATQQFNQEKQKREQIEKNLQKLKAEQKSERQKLLQQHENEIQLLNQKWEEEKNFLCTVIQRDCNMVFERSLRRSSSSSNNNNSTGATTTNNATTTATFPISDSAFTAIGTGTGLRNIYNNKNKNDSRKMYSKAKGSNTTGDMDITITTSSQIGPSPRSLLTPTSSEIVSNDLHTHQNNSKNDNSKSNENNSDINNSNYYNDNNNNLNFDWMNYSNYNGGSDDKNDDNNNNDNDNIRKTNSNDNINYSRPPSSLSNSYEDIDRALRETEELVESLFRSN